MTVYKYKLQWKKNRLTKKELLSLLFQILDDIHKMVQ